jgi:hypothetical protein
MDTPASPWRELPGTYTTGEIWMMRVEGLFVAAIPCDEVISDKETSGA